MVPLKITVKKPFELLLTGPMRDTIKVIIDIVGSLILLILISPLLLILAALILIDSRGPVFYLQKRCGKDEREFHMLKLRTMVKEADAKKNSIYKNMNGPVLKIKQDPRITKVGALLRRWSLDEIPQLFNVLKGDMSLVGPRPLAREEMEGFDEWRAVRLSVKPGMTGLWQIKGRQSGQFSDWIKYDSEYVSNRSLLLDLKILYMTIFAVIKGKGAY